MNVRVFDQLRSYSPDKGARVLRAMRWTSQQGLLSTAGIAGIVAIICGLALRVVQFLANRSIYIDEAALGLNLRGRSFMELAHSSLEFAQTGALGMLFGQKLLLTIFGEHEFVLRSIPFAASILSLPLFFALARRYVDGAALVMVTTVFAFSFPLVYFSADAKPYSLDLLLTILVLLTAQRLAEHPLTPWRTLGYGVTGAAIMWLSQSVLFVLGAVAIIVLREEWRRTGSLGLPALLLPVIWGVNGIASVKISAGMLTAEQRAYMHDFWATGFAPVPPRTLTELFWLPMATVRVTIDVLGSAFPVFLTFVLLSGLLVLFRRGTTKSALVLVPICLTLAASALGQYPFGGDHGALPGRTLLFLAPCFLLAAGSGLQELPRRLPRWIHVTMIGAIIAGNVVPLARQFPIARDEIRPVLEHVAAQRKDDDFLYIYYGARHAFEWYAPSLALLDAERAYGTCARTAPELYVSDTARIPTHGRVWLIISHSVAREPRLIVSQFHQRGTEIARIITPGAAAILFDMEQLPTNPVPAPPPHEIAVDGFLMLVGCRGLYEWS